MNWTKTIILSAATIICTLGMTGCGTKSGTKTATTAVPEAPKTHCVVYGIDITGSYTYTSQSYATAGNDLTKYAGPGDVWFFRTIDNRSYSDRAAIMALTCPPPLRTSANPYDKRAALARQSFQSSFDKLKSDAATYLSKQQPNIAKGTDIYGFLAKAGELLATAPAGSRKVLIMCTDLGDTLSREASIDLKGVNVIVRMFQSGEKINRVQKLKSVWTSRLKTYGAASVIIIDPSQSISADML